MLQTFIVALGQKQIFSSSRAESRNRCYQYVIIKSLSILSLLICEKHYQYKFMFDPEYQVESEFVLTVVDQ